MSTETYGLDRARAGRRGLYVYNVHSRVLPVPATRAGELLDSLASPADRLWPFEAWPRMRFTWRLIFRPVHDALIEDSLSKAERSLGLEPHATAWSTRVRLLRALLARAGRR